MWYLCVVLRKFVCSISNFKINFFCACTAHETVGGEWYFFMLDVLFSRWVFIHLSLHESTAKVLGMPSPEMKNEFTLCCQIINSLEMLVWKAPVDTASHGKWSMVEKGINFNFCLGTGYDISSMESIGNYSIVFIDRKSMPPKMFYLYIFRFDLWHLYKSLLPSAKGLSFTLWNFYFWNWVSILS